MKSKINNIKRLFLIIMCIQINLIFAQPYYYYYQPNESLENNNIIQLNLSNGIKNSLINDVGNISQIFWSSDETFLILQMKSTLDIIKLDNLNQKIRIMENVNWVLDILDAPNTNRLYISLGSIEYEYDHTIVLDRTTFSPIDTIDFYSYYKIFLSKNENIMYRCIPDLTGIYFQAIDPIQNILLYEKKKTGTIGPFTNFFELMDARKGKALIFFNEGYGYENQKFVICNPDSGIFFAPISCKFRAKGHLSSSGNYIIIEQVDYNGSGEDYTGHVLLYDAYSGSIISTLSLPPAGNIYTFDNFADNFYYYIASSEKIYSFNIDSLINHQQAPNLTVKLTNSHGSLLTTGTLQYYEGSWKNAVNNGDGIFTVTTNLNAVSLRMTYEYGSQTVSNITSHNNTYTFQTVNTTVELRNSANTLIDQGTVQYYPGAWRDIGVTSNGITSKELLPGTYSFRMTYAGGSNDKQQNIGTNPVVVFQTVNTSVELRNSSNTLIDQGTVQYYAGSWRSFGTTSNGTVSKELLPNNYSFRMSYEFVSNDRQQNIGTNSTVTFSTVLCTVRVKNSQNQPLNNAAIKYYSGAWRTIGNTVNGEITKELLPANITFRANYGTAQQDKTVNLSTINLVEFIFP